MFSLHPTEGEMGSSLPKQLVTQTHFQPLSSSGPGFVKTKAQMVKTSDSWECQITPPLTEQLETSELQLRPSSGEKQQYKRGW